MSGSRSRTHRRFCSGMSHHPASRRSIFIILSRTTTRAKAHLRVLTPRLLADVHAALCAGGLFVVQTDNPDYWAYMTRVLPSFFEFREHPEPWPDAPDGRTRREILARRRGLTIFRGLGIRRDELSRESIAALAETLPLPEFRSRGPWCELDRWESPAHDG